MSGRFSVPVAVQALLVRDGRLLTLRRTGTGHRDGELGLPAGHLEGGEDAVDGWSGEPRTGEPGRCSELAWVDPDDPPADVVDHVRCAVGAWRAGRPLVLHGWAAGGTC
ncbi:NUDIX hydrolase [Kineococcus arenarius]|uniref:hypothetical protein n=1 Tax=Kineococcus sp. SYSU DK007 TaxID=3383128 RepID=UPI003D7E6EB8